MHYLILLTALLFSTSGIAAALNGFDLDNSLIDTGDIMRGGPPRDGIPAIDDPRYLAASDSDWLKESDRVLGIEINGEARAFPIRILNWHEIVNDNWAGAFVVVSYCPLCGTGMIFDAKLDGEPVSFGVSGLLYQSDMLLYDRKTDSLWSQIMGQAVSGPMAGTELKLLPAITTSFANWKQRYPDSLVLSTDTGFTRDYNRDPYQGYEQSRRLMFPVNNLATGPMHPKEEVLGVSYKGKHIAFPFGELSANGEERFDYDWQGKTWKVNWSEDGSEAFITDENGELYPSVNSFWFAWFSFNPETHVFSATEN